MGYSAGLGDRSAEKSLDTSYSETISLPMRSFNNNSVIVETSLDRNIITINYDSALPGPSPIVPPPREPGTTTVLPAIDTYLPKDKVLTISAQIPKEGPGSGVFTKFNKEYLQILEATVDGSTIKYAFQWAKIPPSTTSLQTLEITTSAWNDKVAVEGKTISTIQGYAVRYAVVN